MGSEIVIGGIALLFLLGRKKKSYRGSVKSEKVDGKISEEPSKGKPPSQDDQKQCPHRSSFDLSKLQYIIVSYEGGDGAIFDATIPKIGFDRVKSGELDLIQIVYDTLSSQGLNRSCFDSLDTRLSVKTLDQKTWDLSAPKAFFQLGSDLHHHLWNIDLIQMENPFISWWKERFPNASVPKEDGIEILPLSDPR